MEKDILINNETGIMIIVDDIREWQQELENGYYNYVGPAEEEETRSSAKSLAVNAVHAIDVKVTNDYIDNIDRTKHKVFN